MENSIFGAALVAVLAATSCMDGGVLPDTGYTSQIIEFGVRKSQSCKTVSEVSDATFSRDGSSFRVAAVSRGEEYFNEPAVRSAGTFLTCGRYYYPSDTTTDFFAVYPTGESIDVSGGGASVGFISDGLKDFVTASAYGRRSSSEPVRLEFAHALSQLRFDVCSADSAAACEVLSITVRSPRGGLYTFSPDGDFWRPYPDTVTVIAASASVPCATFVPVGESATFLPGEAQFTVIWRCLQKGACVGEYTRSAGVSLLQGLKNTVRLTLDNCEAEPLSFSLSVEEWQEREIDVNLE